MCREFSYLQLTVVAGRETINILPDDVLLIIFYFDGPEDDNRLWYPSWHRLVHVCRRWRSLVFASPNFLDLRLVFDPRTRVELAGIWPPFPIIIKNFTNWPFPEIDATIVHRDRVREIDVFLSRLQLQRLISAMREPFPALTHIRLGLNRNGGVPPVLPDDFLGGCALRLQSLELQSISFPALPKFLLSAVNLVDITLWDTLHSTYISPETLVTCLAVLANLKFLSIEFHSSSPSHPDRVRQHPLPPARIVLPSLVHFKFVWVSEYLEDLVDRIDAPLLDSVCIIFFYEYVFNIPEFGRFLRRTPKFQTLNEAHVDFDRYGVLVSPLPPTWIFGRSPGLRIRIQVPNWRFSYMAHTLASLFPSVYMVEHLYIYGSHAPYLLKYWRKTINGIRWLEIFHPFTAVKNLYLRKEIAQYISPVLQELEEESVTNVLPVLEGIFVEEVGPSGPIQVAIGKFVAARQLLGHPVAVSLWNGT